MNGQNQGSGDRNRLVIIQTLEPVEGSGRFPTATPEELAREYMSRAEAPGAEGFAADQTSARYDTVWTMPYRTDMDPDSVDVPKTKRLIFGGRAYDIVGARLTEDDSEIELRTIAGSRVSE